MTRIRKSFSRLKLSAIIPILLTSCSTLPVPGTIRGGFFSSPHLPFTLNSCTISLSDRTGLPKDNRVALQYLETALAQRGIAPTPNGIFTLEVTFREQSIENSLQGILSISAILKITDSQNQVLARIIYLGYSKEGMESDLLMFRIINRLVKKLTHAVSKGKSW